MNQELPFQLNRQRRLNGRRQALKIALIYVVLSGLWILYSDELIATIASSQAERVLISVAKGWIFVILTGCLLYQLLVRVLAKWDLAVGERWSAETARHETDKKLLLSEERLRLVFEAMADGLWDRDLKSGIVYLSPSYCNIMGYPAREAKEGVEFLKRLVHPQDWPRLLGTINDHLAGKSSNIICEYRIITKDGDIKWILSRGKVVERAPDGSPLRVMGTISDITQRKEAEAVMLEREQLHRLVVEATPDSIFILQQNRFVFLNQAALKLFGASRREELLGRDGFDFVHPDFREIVRDRIALAEQAGQTQVLLEQTLLRLDGSTVDVEATSGRFRFQGRPAVLVEARDITGRKRSELELRKLSRAVEQTPATVVITDVHGAIEYVNPKFVEVTGYTVAEALGRNPRILKSGRHTPEFYRVMWDTLLQGKVWQGEVCNRKKNGQLYWESACISPIRDEQGRTTHFVAIKEDITNRKRAEAELAETQKQLLESERQQKAILDNIPDLAWLRDRDGRFLAVNRAWCEFAGMKAADIIGKTILDLPEMYPVAVAADLKAEDDRVVLTGKPLRGEARLNSSSLGAAWFETSKTPLVDELGKVYGLAGIARDITARKRAEEELQWKTAFLEAQMNSSIDGILAVDEHGKKTLQNRRLNELFSIPQSIVEDADDVKQIQWVAQVAKDSEQFIAKVGYLYTHPTAIRRDELELKDGTILDRYTAPMMGKNGKCYGRMWTFRDITEKKRADAALKERLALQGRLAKIAANAPGVIYAFRLRPDGSSCVPYVSPTVDDFFGVKAEDILNDALPILSIVHPDDQFRMFESIAESARTMLPWRLEFRVQHHKKGVFWVEGQSTPEREADGGTLWHGFMSDITERKGAAEQLMLAKQAADSANRAKSEFLAAMSHEIRTPMNGLIGFTNLLLDTQLSEEQRQFVETIEFSGKTLLKLINDILDLSKIEAGKLNVSRIGFCLPEVVDEVAGMLGSQARQKGLVFHAHCDPSLSQRVAGDPDRVRQVLVNLVGNAIKFTKQGGISITLQPAARRGCVRCQVADTGIGIPPDQHGLLFQNFSQVSSADTHRLGGTGLGLAISKRLVELMGGEIGLTSVPGKGSTFWFTLPTETPEPTPKLPDLVTAPLDPGVEHLPNGDQVRVLLADDDETNRVLLKHLLEKLSCQVDLAVNGMEATALFAKNPYDLILLDCLMPVLDGWEAAQQMRQMSAGKWRVPIIATTASLMPEQRERCRQSDMDDVLEKPILTGALQQMLTKWTRRPRQLNRGESASVT